MSQQLSVIPLHYSNNAMLKGDCTNIIQPFSLRLFVIPESGLNMLSPVVTVSPSWSELAMNPSRKNFVP